LEEKEHFSKQKQHCGILRKSQIPGPRKKFGQLGNWVFQPLLCTAQQQKELLAVVKIYNSVSGSAVMLRF